MVRVRKNSLDQTQMEEYSKKLTMKIVAMTDYNKNHIDSNYGNHDANMYENSINDTNDNNDSNNFS